MRSPRRSTSTFRARATWRSLALAGALCAAGMSVTPNLAGASPRSTTPTFALSAPLHAGSWSRLVTTPHLLIALSKSALIATSSDGHHWRTLPTPGGEWNVLAYGSGRYVALSANSQALSEMTSTDGLHWSALSVPRGPWTGLAYGDGRFVAVSRAGQFMESTDGLHWAMTWVRSQFALTSLAFGAGRFVAVDAHDGDDLISVNGVGWSFYPITHPLIPWTSVTYANGVFVALSPRGLSATSMLGYQWVTHPATRGLSDPLLATGCSLALGLETTTSGPTLLRSQWGQSWSIAPLRTLGVTTWSDLGTLGRVVVLLGPVGQMATWTLPGYCGPTLPSPPRDVSGNTESTQVWTYQHPSTETGGAPIDEYVVTLTSAGAPRSCVAPLSFEPHCLITGLVNNRQYTLTTRSRNRFGFSAPSDPEWVVPVAHWTLATWSPTPTVKAGHVVTIYVTGILANAEGIYPQSPVSVHVGTTLLTCVPSPFGECRFDLRAPAPGLLHLWSSYTGYGSYYQSPVTTLRVTN